MAPRAAVVREPASGDRRVLVLLARSRETGAVVTVPGTALAQAIRRPERQAAWPA